MQNFVYNIFMLKKFLTYGNLVFSLIFSRSNDAVYVGTTLKFVKKLKILR